MFANQPFLRDDTFLGACEGLGKDLGFPPTLLRVVLALTLYFFPAATLATYLALATLVFVTRLIAPDPLVAAAPVRPAAPGCAPEPEPVELAKAA